MKGAALDISNWISDWNPQLGREIKARVNWRSFLVTTIASLFVQVCLVRLFLEAPVSTPSAWRFAAFWLFHQLTGIGLTLLVLVGIYLLVQNFATEAKRGTLTLLRLAPEPTERILLGKLIGVPVLLYWAIALVIPLHLWAAAQAEIEVVSIFFTYVFSGLICSLLQMIVLSLAIGSGEEARGWTWVIVAGIPYAIGLSCWSQVVWFSQSNGVTFPDFIRDLVRVSYVLILVPFLFWIVSCFWRSCVQEFRSPSSASYPLDPSDYELDKPIK